MIHRVTLMRSGHGFEVQEGNIDSSHIGFVHGMQTMSKATQYNMGVQAKFVAGDVHPKFEIVEKPNGLLQGARRDADDGQCYWRIGGWLMPCFTLLPGFPGDSPLGGHAWVPVDDNKVWVFGVNWHPRRKLTASELQQYHEGSPTGLHSTMTPGSFTALRNKSNCYAHADAPPNDPREFRYRGISCVLPCDVASWADALAEAMDARPETFTESV